MVFLLKWWTKFYLPEQISKIHNNLMFSKLKYLPQIWIEFDTLQGQPTLAITSWKPQNISVINSI